MAQEVHRQLGVNGGYFQETIHCRHLVSSTRQGPQKGFTMNRAILTALMLTWLPLACYSQELKSEAIKVEDVCDYLKAYTIRLSPETEGKVRAKIAIRRLSDDGKWEDINSTADVTGIVTKDQPVVVVINKEDGHGILRVGGVGTDVKIMDFKQYELSVSHHSPQSFDLGRKEIILMSCPKGSVASSDMNEMKAYLALVLTDGSTTGAD
jgi:hypothetical protein